MEDEPQVWRNNVAAVVMDDAGNVLLGSNPLRSPYWHFPQGGVGKKELLAEAVLRELREEVGLLPENLRIVAALGGLRYRYRGKNFKSLYWLGQDQTYFLLRCRGVMPETDCSASEEFSSVMWMPWQRLEADLFVPFKRGVIERVLSLFFPRTPEGCEPEEYARRIFSCERYRYGAVGQGLRAVMADDSALFAGGKGSIEWQMEDLRMRLKRVQGKRRILIQVLGMKGSGKSSCLRRLALSMDPLYTRALPPQPPVALEAALAAARPEPQQALLLASTAYDLLWQRLAAQDASAWEDWRRVQAWEETLEAEGCLLLKFYLHTSYACYLQTAEDEGLPLMSREDWERDMAAAESLLAAAGRSPWYILPADRRWYRNYVALRLLTERLESLA